MTPQQAAALANSVAHLNILYLVVSLCVIFGTFGILMAIGERALGFNIKRFLNHVEKKAAGGDVWPGVVLVLGVLSLMGIVLWVGLR